MKVRDILTGPETWRQGAEASTVNGVTVNPLSPDAVRFCLLGAVNRAYDQAGLEEKYDVIEQLNKAVYEAGWNGGLISYNDAPCRTFAEVKALVDRLDI